MSEDMHEDKEILPSQSQESEMLDSEESEVIGIFQ